MAQIYGELIRAQLQSSATNLSSAAPGLIYLNSGDKKPTVYDGTSWQKLVNEAALADLSALPIITLAKGGLGANASAWSGFVKISAGTASAAALSASDLPIVTAAKGGLGADASAFAGVVKAAAGVFSASTIVNADVSATAAIDYSKLSVPDAAIPQAKVANLTTDLAGKVTANLAITGATKTKITYDSKGLVTAGSDLVSADIPATLLSKVVSSTPAMTGALTLPVGTTSDRTGLSTQGMVRYNTTDATFEGYNGVSWGAIGGGGGGTIDTITQASHGFVVGDVLYLNGSTYTKAIASAANTAEVVGVVSSVITASQFQLTLSGEISGLEAADFEENALPAVGEVLFLSGTTAGKLTITEPSTIGYVSIPVGVVSESVVGPPASRKMYVAIKRGVVVGGANARTQIPLGGSTSTSVTTTVQNVAAYEAGELSGWIAISATTPLKFYVTAQFSKNGAGNNYNISYQTSGDTPPVGFVLQVTSAGLIQAVLPSITGFTSASITYGLDVAAIGTSFPLSVDGSSITTGTINAVRIPSLDASKITTGTLDAARIPSLDSSKIVWSEPVAFRNKIINGNFDIWQRGTSFSLTTNYTYTADRWAYVFDGSGATRTVSRQNFAINQTQVPGAPKYFINSTQSVAGTGGTFNALVQRIESVRTFAGQTVTVSFWAKSSTGSFIVVGLGQRASTNVFTSIFVPTLTSTWTKYTGTITLPAIASGITEDGNDNLELAFNFPLNAIHNIDIAQVQLEAGSVATPFEQRPIGTELALCQRYFQRISGLSVALVPEGSSGNNCRAGILLPVSIRSSASGTHTGSILVNGVVQTYTSRSFGASGNICNITAFGGPSAYGNSVMGTLDFDVNAEL